MKNLVKWEYIILGALAGLLAWFLTGDSFLGILVFGFLLVPAWSDVYREYAKDNPRNLWFKRKLYGWGWVPVKWQGWVTIFLYVALLAYFLTWADANSHSVSDTLTAFFFPFIILTTLLISICYLKGERPGWQWGMQKDKDTV